MTTDREKITTLRRLLGTLERELKRSVYIGGRKFTFNDNGSMTSIYEKDTDGQYKLVAGRRQ